MKLTFTTGHEFLALHFNIKIPPLILLLFIPPCYDFPLKLSQYLVYSLSSAGGEEKPRPCTTTAVTKTPQNRHSDRHVRMSIRPVESTHSSFCPEIYHRLFSKRRVQRGGVVAAIATPVK